MTFILLIAFQVKHFVADYPLQGWPWTLWMLGKFRDRGWVAPLAGHAGVHAVLTLAIVLAVDPTLWWLALVDFGVHFTMDRLKAGRRWLGRFKGLSAAEWATLHVARPPDLARRLRDNAFFWWSIGLDQMVHHLTHYYIVWQLVSVGA